MPENSLTWLDAKKTVVKMAGDRFHTACGGDVFYVNWRVYLYVIWRLVCDEHFNKSNSVKPLSIISEGTTKKW